MRNRHKLIIAAVSASCQVVHNLVPSLAKGVGVVLGASGCCGRGPSAVQLFWFCFAWRDGRAMGCRMSTGNETKGFALLIKAPRVVRRFVPLKGETISIRDESGKEIWSLTLPIPIEELFMKPATSGLTPSIDHCYKS